MEVEKPVLKIRKVRRLELGLVMVVELFTIVKMKDQAWAWVVTMMLVLEVRKEGTEAPFVESSEADVLGIVVAR